MGKMGELYLQIMEANQGEYPEDLSLSQVAEMNRLKIYNKEEYEKWKKSHPETRKDSFKDAKNAEKKE